MNWEACGCLVNFIAKDAAGEVLNIIKLRD